ncbi:aliphatic sulfonate ABC transporter substrate-binding protein [Brevibacillus marinus]|uniref:aliphatic sulfonate ABC transporter substrate-binding protein n=1 Tax=Brevibacillus marinus TaxID=2496837 RepID=UPI000F81FB4F|nr:aliphatic sulfonate ABC transporter substrate-binding protein [Brevibacillus marinus]
MRKVYSVLLFILLFFSLGLAACGQTETTNSASTASTSTASPADPSASSAPSEVYPEKLRIGYQKGGTLIILKASGQLEKALAPHNVEVEWVEFAYGPPLMEAMNAGEIDFGYTGATPPVFAQAGDGPNLAYVGYGPSSKEGYGIIVPKDSPAQSLQDLKHKKIALSKGSAGHYLLVKALRKEGLTLEDIEPVYLSYSEARTAFERGDVDAWVVPDPRFADAEETIGARPVATGVGLPVQYNFYLANKSFAERYPAVLRVALDELNKIEQHAKDNIDETANFLEKDTGIPVNIWKRALKRQAWGAQYPLTQEVLDSQQQVADTFFEIKQIPKQIQVKEAVIDLTAK